VSYVYPSISVLPVAVFERDRGYTGSLTKVLDEDRAFNCEIRVLGDCRACVAIINLDDVVSTKTITQITAPDAGYSLSAVYDKDDSTYARWTIPYKAVRDLFSVDFGSAFAGCFRIRGFFQSGALQVEIHGSNDGSTWTVLYSYGGVAGDFETFVFLSGYRYYKLVVGNTDPLNNYYVDIRGFEAYTSYQAPYSRSLNVNRRVCVFVYGGRYQVLEVIRL
jgi:hypothetical protein